MNIDFLIPVYVDHPDRIRNYEIVTNYLHQLKINQIYVLELYKDKPQLEFLNNVNYFSQKQNEEFFNKTKSFNFLAKQSTADLIALYDVDVLIKYKDLIQAETELKNNKYDLIYPYNGHFYNVPKEIVNKLNKNLNTPFNLSDCTLFNPNSRGGAVIFKKDVFFKGGGGNEYFKNVGYDDDEIFRRFERLEYRIGRTQSPLFHLDHYRGTTSFNYNDHINYNQKIFMETFSKTKEQLEDYIATWEWTKC